MQEIILQLNMEGTVGWDYLKDYSDGVSQKMI